MNKLKKLFLDIEATVYSLIFISIFSIVGAMIIYFIPEAYSLISQKPLFTWLSQNRDFHTFWLYLIIVLFAFTGITGIICFLKDIKNIRIFPAIFHLSFLAVLIAHLILSLYGFRVKEVTLPYASPETVLLPPPFKPLKIFFRDVDYEQNPYGIITNIKAQVIYLDGNKEKQSDISINNPLKISDFHVVLKDLSSFLMSVSLRLSDGTNNETIIIPIDKPFLKGSTKISFLANNQNFSQIKLLIEENSQKEVFYVGLGSTITFGGKNYRVLSLTPNVVPALIVDITYDPSLLLIFIASTLFTIGISLDAIKRLFRFFIRQNKDQSLTS